MPLITLGAWSDHLPAVNAVLNGCSTVLLLAGYIAIRRKAIGVHRACMISALITSALFLISYLTHKASHGTTYFGGTGLARTVYFTILTSHTILAVVIVPLILITVSRALRERFDKHRRIARITWPLWIYVSVTGIVVFFMLYRFYPNTKVAPPLAPAVAAAVR